MSEPVPDRAAGTVDPGAPVMTPAGAPNVDGAAGVVDPGAPVIAPDLDGAARIVDHGISMVSPAVTPTSDSSAATADYRVSVVPPAGTPAAGTGVAAMIEHRLSAIPPAAQRLQGRRAGLITRLLANTVDFGVAAAVVAAGYFGFAALLFLWNSRSFRFPDPGFGLLVIAGGVVMTLYLTACWTATGRTYGDHLLGLRVLGLRGRPPLLVPALLRAVLCVVFPIGLFWIVISRDNRSVQDVLLRSSVVYDWSRTPLSGRR